MLTIRYFEEAMDKLYMEGQVHGTGYPNLNKIQTFLKDA
jgi:TPP-dependent pyruvate/acetoin dehydrogenase alpha subunit